jgi:hypothetical protein
MMAGGTRFGHRMKCAADRARATIFGARTLSLTSGAAGGAGFRRAAGPARSRAPANLVLVAMGSDDGALSTLRRRAGRMWRRDVAAAVRWVTRQTKSPPRMAPRGLNNF